MLISFFLIDNFNNIEIDIRKHIKKNIPTDCKFIYLPKKINYLMNNKK